MSKHPIIVYNCSYNGLSIIQELGSIGINCIALDKKYSVGAFSKYAKFKLCPDPIKQEKGFIEFLYKLCERLPLKPVLFPTNDEWALVTAKYKEYLSEVSFPCISNYETTSTILSKDLFYQTGKKRNYLTPITWTKDEVLLINNIDFPIVAKAKYKSLPYYYEGVNLDKYLKKNRLVVLHDKKQLNNYIIKNQEILPHVVFQEYVEGLSDSMFTVGIYADSNNEIKAVFTGRKVRGYPADIGDNILGESHKVPELLIENTVRIVNEMSFEGIAEFEYKKDEKTGDYSLIEINPRPWSWIGITPYCGVNIPYIAYKSLLGEEVSFQKSEMANGEVKYVKIYQDFLNCMFRYRYNHKPWNLSYSKWKKSLKASRLVVAENNKGDWPIWFASVPYLFGKLFTQKLH